MTTDPKIRSVNKVLRIWERLRSPDGLAFLLRGGPLRASSFWRLREGKAKAWGRGPFGHPKRSHLAPRTAPRLPQLWFGFREAPWEKHRILPPSWGVFLAGLVQGVIKRVAFLQHALYYMKHILSYNMFPPQTYFVDHLCLYNTSYQNRARRASPPHPLGLLKVLTQFGVGFFGRGEEGGIPFCFPFRVLDPRIPCPAGL